MKTVTEQKTAREFVVRIVYVLISNMPLKYWFLVFYPFCSSKSNPNFILFLLKFEECGNGKYVFHMDTFIALPLLPESNSILIF